MSDTVDICIVGGGPAGMAAATMAAAHGFSVALIDERSSVGGQIYRGLDEGPFRNGAALGTDYSAGSRIIARLKAADVKILLNCSLWRIDMAQAGGTASYTRNGVSLRLYFRRLILATGAIERPVAFEGWTLPGVMNVGAAQLLLKSAAVVPSGRIVLAGNGPLMPLFATQLLALGVTVAAFLDTAPKTGGIGIAARNLIPLIRNHAKVRKGIAMLHRIRSAGLPVHRDVSRMAAHGDHRVRSVTFEADGQQHDIETDTLLIHEGIIPNTQLSRAIGLKHVWDHGQTCWRPETDEFGESSIAGVFVIGDGAAITGAVAAPASGEIAMGRILEQLGRADDRSRMAIRSASKLLVRERAFRPFLDALYPPRISNSPVSDTTIVCRCEEVSAGEVRSAIEDGAIGPAQAKAFTRCGMGPCQGRVCGPIVTRLIAEETSRQTSDIDPYNVRFPLKPLTLSDIAGGDKDEAVKQEDHHAA